MASINPAVTAAVIITVATLVLFVLYIASRYRKFRTNEYVIHLRNGVVKSAGRGGKIIKLPLVDEIIVIPTTTRKTLLNSSEKILSREYQDVKISAILYWRVSDPSTAFNAVVWDRNSNDYVERVLSTATEAIIRTTCASLTIEKILCDRTEIIKMIADQLLNLTKDWGIIIESLEIIEVEVLDSELKNNMETVKKMQEKQKAKLSAANAAEVYKLKEIDVQRQTDLASKEMSIQIQEREMRRLEIEAETYSKAKLIRAEADATSIKMIQLAKFEAEAEGIRIRMAAEAEGIQKQVDALRTAGDEFMSLKLIEKMPEIYSHLSPDKMIIMGEGNQGFNSIIQSVLPLMQILPEFNTYLKKGLKNPQDNSSKTLEKNISKKSISRTT